MKSERYSLSFTTGSLFHQASVETAALFITLGNWKTVREKIISDNLLQTRTLNTLKRVCREIISRLKTLGPHEIDLLVRGSVQEQGYILWIAICRRYQFIADFAVEVVRENYIGLKPDILYEDFDSFFNRKAEWHPEMDAIRPATRNKLPQVLFKILREAGLLTSNNMIQAALLSSRLLETILHSNPQNIQFFPVFDSELKWLP
jgi:hypothetical protein